MATAQSVRAAPYAPPGPRLPLLPILDGYIVRELTAPFLFWLAAFMIFWFGNIFFLAAEYIINSHASVFLVLRFLLFRVPQSTPFAFPFACLFATLHAFGRLVADNEVTALRTSGISFKRIAQTPISLGILLFGVAYYVNDTVVPRAVELSTRTFYQIIYNTATLPIVPQFFRKDDTTGRVFYVGEVREDHRTMENVMIFENATRSPFRQVMNAERAHLDGQTLVLSNARVARFKRTGELEGEVHTRDNVRVGLPVGENADQFLNTASSDTNTLNSHQLRAQITALETTGQGGSALDLLKMVLAQKVAFPFASFVAVLIALPLAVLFGRKGRTLGIALSILVFFIYFLLMSAFFALGKSGALNPYLAAWIPNIVTGLVGAGLFGRVER